MEQRGYQLPGIRILAAGTGITTGVIGNVFTDLIKQAIVVGWSAAVAGLACGPQVAVPVLAIAAIFGVARHIENRAARRDAEWLVEAVSEAARSAGDAVTLLERLENGRMTPAVRFDHFERIEAAEEVAAELRAYLALLANDLRTLVGRQLESAARADESLSNLAIYAGDTNDRVRDIEQGIRDIGSAAMESARSAKASELARFLPVINRAVEFRYEKPVHYKDMADWMAKLNLVQYVKECWDHGIDDNPDLFQLAKKVANYLYLVGEVDTAAFLRGRTIRMISSLFDPASATYQAHYSRALHDLTSGTYDTNPAQFDYCKSAFGVGSVQTVGAMTCRACIMLRKGRLNDAAGLLSEVEQALAGINEASPQFTERKAALALQKGRLHLLEGTFRNDRRNLEQAVLLLSQALELDELLVADHVAVNYIHFFLYLALRGLGHAAEALRHRDRAKAFFQSTPLRNLCLHDFGSLKTELGLP